MYVPLFWLIDRYKVSIYFTGNPFNLSAGDFLTRGGGFRNFGAKTWRQGASYRSTTLSKRRCRTHRACGAGGVFICKTDSLNKLRTCHASQLFVHDRLRRLGHTGSLRLYLQLGHRIRRTPAMSVRHRHIAYVLLRHSLRCIIDSTTARSLRRPGNLLPASAIPLLRFVQLGLPASLLLCR